MKRKTLKDRSENDTNNVEWLMKLLEYSKKYTMAMGSNNMPHTLVLAWLNSLAWASKPNSIVRSSYSLKEINTIHK